MESDNFIDYHFAIPSKWNAGAKIREDRQFLEFNII